MPVEAAVEEAMRHLPNTTRLLLVIDQFEEIFAPSAPSASLPQQGDQSSSHGAAAATRPDARRRFIDDVLRVPRESAARVVMTLRGDFYGYATTVNRALSDVIARTVVNVGPMTPQELQSAIEQPAVRCRFRFETGLIGRILGDVDSQPGSLALLEFALTELWNKRRGRVLTHEGYQATGGVQGAVTKRADTVCADLTTRYPDRVLPVISRLVHVTAASEEGGDTRQVVPLAELSQEEVAIVREFADARLLVISGTQDPGGGRVEVAHEALIRHWSALGDFIDRERTFLIWRQRLVFLMREWSLANRSEETLLRGPFLRDAMQWSREGKLSEAETAFVAASEQAERARRSAMERPRRWLFAGIGVAAALALSIAGWWTWTRTDSYQISAIVAEAPRLLPSASRGPATDAVRTLAMVSSPPGAAEAAMGIGDVEGRGEALTASAALLVRTNRTAEATALAEQAMAILAVEGSGYQVVNALVESGSILIRAGNASRAIEIGRTIRDPATRAGMLSGLVPALQSSSGQALALSIAKEAAASASQDQDASDRASALLAAERALRVAGDADSAATAAVEAGKAAWRLPSGSTMVVSIFAALTRAGKTVEANGILPAAVEVVERSAATDFGFHRHLLGSLLQSEQFDTASMVAGRLLGEAPFYYVQDAVVYGLRTLAATGREKQATKAAKLFDTLVDESSISAAVAAGLIDAGKLDQAQALAAGIADDADRAGTLAALVRGLAKAGRVTETGTIAAASLGPASGIGDATLLTDAAGAVVVAPVVPETEKAVNLALTAASRITDRYDRLGLLLALTPALQKAGASEHSMAAAREAFDLARPWRSSSSSRDDENLRLAADALVRALQQSEALELALALNPEVHAESGHPTTLAVVARALSAAGHAEAAATAADRAFAAMNKVTGDDERSAAYQEVASALATLHLYRRARATADLCALSDDRLRAYTAILQQWAIQRDASLMKILEELRVTP